MVTQTTQKKDEWTELPCCTPGNIKENIIVCIAERLGKQNNINYYKKPDGCLYSKIPPVEFDFTKQNHPNINHNTENWVVSKETFAFGKEPRPFAEILLTADNFVNLPNPRMSDVITEVLNFLTDETRMTTILEGNKVVIEIDYKNQKILLRELN